MPAPLDDGVIACQPKKTTVTWINHALTNSLSSKATCSGGDKLECFFLTTFFKPDYSVYQSRMPHSKL